MNCSAENTMKTAGTIRTGTIERWLSMAILILIAVIGIAVYLRQFDFNPAVVAFQPESHGNGLPETSIQENLIDTAGTEIFPFSPPEYFNPDTLYEKINGRADLYLASGFSSLQTQRFAISESADQWVEIFVYEMSSAENAFSVFSMQRRSDDTVDTRLPNAYHTENALFMVIGKFYVEIIGTDTSDRGKQARKILSDKCMDKFGSQTGRSMPNASLFPSDGFIATSLQIIASNAFGHEALDRVFTGEYRIDGAQFTAFVSERENAEAAISLAAAYQSALLSYGAEAVDRDTGIDDAVVIRFFDTYEIIFSRGKFFAGVHEAKELEAAIRLATALSTHLEALDER
jgi:hypothetical protein